MSTLPGLPHFGTYQLITADYPWAYENPQGPGGTGDHYEGLPLEDGKLMPVGALADPRGALLAMWCTGPMAAEGAHNELGMAWGFGKARTLLFEWVKVANACMACGDDWDQHATPRVPGGLPGPCGGCSDDLTSGCMGFQPNLDAGCGSYTMSNCEQVWLFAKGPAKWSSNRAVRNVRQVIFAPVDTHSRKPEAMQTLLERLWPNAGPKLELFARRNRPGWDCWGNEAPSPTLVFGTQVGTTWPRTQDPREATCQPRGEALTQGVLPWAEDCPPCHCRDGTMTVAWRRQADGGLRCALCGRAPPDVPLASNEIAAMVERTKRTKARLRKSESRSVSPNEGA